MEGFRQVIKGWLGKVLLGIVVVLFSLYGAESLMVVFTKPKPVASVNGEEITEALLTQRVDSERSRLLSRMGDNPNLDLVDPDNLRPQVLQSLIDRYLVSDLVEEMGLVAPQPLLGEWIRSMPQFQVDGVYSQSVFDATIAQMGYSPGQFLKEISRDYTVTQLRKSLMDTSLLSPNQIDYLMRLQDQERSFRYSVIKHQEKLDSVELVSGSVAEYYENNKDAFQRQEQVQVDYVEFSASNFLEEVSVEEASLIEAYDELVAELQSDENAERKVSHILISVDDDVSEDEARALAVSLRQQLADVESEQSDLDKLFSDLAKEYSDDPGSAESGGDLGYSAKGLFVPEFEDALWSMQVNDISEPVKTEYGFHIIRMLDERKPDIPSFEDERERLRSQLANDFAQEKYIDELEQFQTAVFESDDLKSVADQFGLSVQTSPVLTREGRLAPPFDDQGLASLAFNEEVLDGFNSEVLEIDDGKAFVLHLREYIPASLKPLADVRGQIETLLKQKEASGLAMKHGREIIAEMRSGLSLEAANETYGLQWVSMESVKRSAGGAPPLVMQTVFAMPKPATLPEATVQSSIEGVVVDSDFVVVILEEVQSDQDESSEPETIAQEREEMRGFLEGQMGRFDFQDFFNYFQQSADIDVNLKPASDLE